MPGLRELVAEELMLPVDPRVAAMAAAIAEKHGKASQAVLFYGSCLRQRELAGLMLDFYLIVSDYRAAYTSRWLAVANRLIPPNVFYFEHGGLVSKYAVLSEADFAHECSRDAWTVSTAARFAQPSRLVWSKDEAARVRVIETVSQATPSLLGWAVPASGKLSAIDLWKRAFALTFGAELRAERSDRSAMIVDADPQRYERFAAAASSPGPTRDERWWRGKQRHGKIYSVARLAKASFTFAGGADYIAWKINRHAGTAIALKPWQRRHPLLAAITLLPRLLSSGAVR
ncbi:hypothetical protein [Sphingomonas sp.]|uniref:hypothetical protein n=1 Tax=Sphingomonas sp. TaxID=28214 RepID=UPI0025CEA743|nr:hypothetical protein [Sphingomonas sp.]MBV9528927.1 hypothetical protein [Sphingomonas sp.]